MIKNESELVRKAQAGDFQAFETLIGAHAALIYNLSLRLLGDEREAEDLSQEAMLRAWNALPRFRAEARFSTWLYRIVTNLCYNRLPRLKAELGALDGDAMLHVADRREPADTRVLKGELRDVLHAAIAELPEHYRLLISLRHLQEMSYAEIAEATGMPLGTVKTGIHRGRKRLRAAMVEYMTPQGPVRRSPAMRELKPEAQRV